MSAPRLLRWGCAAIVAGLLIAAAPAAAAVSLPSGFSQTTTVHGLSRPSAVAWTPDGRMLIAMRDGQLRVRKPDGTIVTPLTVPTNTYGDHGFLGIAADKNYASNHYVYLLYTYENDASDYAGPKVSVLERIQLSDANLVSDRQVILGSKRADGSCPAPSNTNNCIPSETSTHSIGTVRVDPGDGTLWVGSGDAADGDGVQNGAFRTYDETSYAGKILHIDGSGNGLAGHSFCPTNGNLTHVCTKVYAKGFRNPFRFTLRPGGGLAVGDVGWNSYEELDLVQAGGDYGWPCWEGPIKTPAYKDDPRCSPGGTYRTHTPPVYSTPHMGTGTAIVGGPTYTGSGYPAAYNGKILFGAYGSGVLNTLDPANGNTVAGFGSGNYGWVDLVSAPDDGGLSYADPGDLTYVDFGDGSDGTGSVGRISYTPGNSPPRVALSASPTQGPAPLSVSFDASGTSDAEGGPLSYSWDFGDGTTATGLDPRQTHTYSSYDRHQAWVTVTDSTGLRASETRRIDVGGPAVTLAAPGNGAQFTAGEPVSLQGSATTPHGPATYSWNVILHHNTHVHDIGTFAGSSTSFTPLVTHDADSYYEITLTASDRNDVRSSRTVTINPRTVSYKLASDPPGAPVSYGGTNQTAPFTTSSAIGYQTSISAAEEFSTCDATYTFSHWSDGGTRLHDVTIPAADTTLTAVYTRTPATTACPLPSPMTPPFSPLTTPTAGATDRTGPTLSLALRRSELRRGRVSGTAADPSNVKTVAVALRARTKSRGRCRWWSLSSRGLRPASSCGQPRWMTAKLAALRADRRTRPWTLSLGRRLPPGRYVLLVRAVDGAGNATAKVGRASEVPVKM